MKDFKKELKIKTVADLNKLVVEKREAIRSSRFGGAGAKVKNVKLTATLRKEIARIMTELTQRKLATQK